MAAIGAGGTGNVYRTRRSRAALRPSWSAVVTVCGVLAIARVAAAQPVLLQPTPLTHWYIERPGIKFIAGDGLMRLTGSGWISARPSYLDFDLRFQFRAVTPDASGALLLRAFPFSPGSLPGIGVRVELAADGSGGPVRNITAYKGKTSDKIPPAALPGSADWHDVAVRAERTTITVAVDGMTTRIVDAPTAWPAGYIGVELRKGTIELRGIAIQSLLDNNACDRGARPFEQPRAQGVVPPMLRRSVKPNYTPDAMRRGAQGHVKLRGVVLADGTVGPVCIVESLDSDLDLQAAAAARQFQFTPGTKDGQPVAVLVSFDIAFTLR